ncbi:MAG TPA: ROK family protein [Acholeplasmataceae bacterium]|nr:ROK family protein [Acholeplasmataceae bacterium]
MERYVYGIDVGGTNIKIGLFSINPIKRITKVEIKTPMENQRTKTFDNIIKKIIEVNEKNKITFENIIGIGLAVPCPTTDGKTGICPNIDLGDLAIDKEFKKRIPKHIEVTVSNDANMAALGEYMQVSQKYKNAVFYTLGTGVGGGVIINGKILEGYNGTAGEFGHMQVFEPNNTMCGCGKSGCLEQVTGTKGMLELAKHFSKYKKSLVEKDELTIKDIYDFAKMGDDVAKRVVDNAMEALATSASILAVTINPDVFIIGGGVSNAGNFLIDRLKHFYQEKARFNTGNTPFILAKLKNDAGIYGAAHYVCEVINDGYKEVLL